MSDAALRARYRRILRFAGAALAQQPVQPLGDVPVGRDLDHQAPTGVVLSTPPGGRRGATWLRVSGPGSRVGKRVITRAADVRLRQAVIVRDKTL